MRIVALLCTFSRFCISAWNQRHLPPTYTGTIQQNDTPSDHALIAVTLANTGIDLGSILSGTVMPRDHSALHGDAARHPLGTEDISIVWTQRIIDKCLMKLFSETGATHGGVP